jgi:type III secretion protein J
MVSRILCAARTASIAVVLCALLSACSDDAELHADLPEADANEVIVALTAAGIESKKLQEKHGFSVHVSQAQLSPAVAVLRAQGLPRSTFARMGDVFKKDGMISTPMEERGRYIYALSQELESTLSQIDGVILARVHPVLPERTLPGDPPQVSSCAVFIKHRADFDTAFYEDRIRQLVALSIPGLAQAPRSKVMVVFTVAAAAEPMPAQPAMASSTLIAIGSACLATVLCAAAALIAVWPKRASWLASLKRLLPASKPA